MVTLVDDAINYFNTFSNNLDSAVMSAAFYLANENATDEQINQFIETVALPDNYRTTFMDMFRMAKSSDLHLEMHLNLETELNS